MTVINLSRAKKRALKKQEAGEQPTNPKKPNQPAFRLERIEPKTENQVKAFDYFYEDKNLVLHGCPGTGKTFIALYLSINEILDKDNDLQKVVIIRSSVSSRDIGFLPGNEKEKMEVYEAPYAAVCSELFKRDDAYGILKQKNQVEFMSSSYIRGITLKNCIVIVDEFQNMNPQELHSIISRIGENSRIILSGDTGQTDLVASRNHKGSGAADVMTIFRHMKDQFGFVNFNPNDILRSGFVKDYILTRLKLESSGKIEPL